MTLPWFRFYHEFAGDPLVQCLAFEDQRHFVMVLCLKAAGVLDRPFPSADFRHRTICRALGLDAVSGSEARRRLAEVGLVDDEWHPPAWDKRQFKSDCSTARVAKHRQKISSQSEEEESKKDSDTDTERNVSGNVSETLQKKIARRGTGIPDDFTLTDDRTIYATARLPKVDAAELLASFRDHHASRGTIAKDWDASWRTWVRNAQKFGYPMIVAAQAPPPPIVRYDSKGRVRNDL